MTSQLGLFDPPVRGTARRRDPKTSKDAARSMSGEVLTAQQRQVLEVIAANPCHGATAYELATQLGFQQNVMARRCTDLGERGFAYRKSGWIGDEEVFVSRPGSSGRQCDAWFATDKGLSWLRGEIDVQVNGYL